MILLPCELRVNTTEEMQRTTKGVSPFEIDIRASGIRPEYCHSGTGLGLNVLRQRLDCN